MTRTALVCALLSNAIGCEAPPLDTSAPIEWIPSVDLDLPMVEGNGELYLDAPELWVGDGRMILRTRPAADAPWVEELLLTFDGRIADEHRSGGDPDSVQIDPLFRAVTPLARASAHRINLFVDSEVSQRMVTEIIYTLGQAETVHFAFAVDDPVRSAMHILPPLSGSQDTDGSQINRLRLTVTVGRSEYRLWSTAVDVPSLLACEDADGACVLPDDPSALRSAAVRLKAGYPDQHTATLAATADITWDGVARAAAALRGTEDAPLFPSVTLTFGAPR